MNVMYCSGHDRSSPQRWRTRSRSSGRALASARSATGSPVSRTTRKIVPLRMKSVATLESTRRMMNCVMPSQLVLHLDIFPWVRVAGRDRREHVLPLLQHHSRADCVDERVPEHRNQIIVVEDRALDLLGDLLALGLVHRPL